MSPPKQYYHHHVGNAYENDTFVRIYLFLSIHAYLRDKEADLQYITASTELLVIDQAEALLMQNWANVLQIVGLLNQRPTKASFSSAARIRLAYLAGYGKLYRQSLIFSAVAAPQIVLLTGECESK